MFCSIRKNSLNNSFNGIFLQNLLQTIHTLMFFSPHILYYDHFGAILIFFRKYLIIKSLRFQSYLNISKQSYFVFVLLIQVLFLHSFPDIVFEPAMHISSLDQQISHIQNLRFVEHRPFSGLDKTLSSIR